MAENELESPPNLLHHLRFVVLEVQKNLKRANLANVSENTGISYSNLCRLRAGGAPSLQTLELLAYYFGPAELLTPSEFQSRRIFPVDTLSRPGHFSMNPPRGM